MRVLEHVRYDMCIIFSGDQDKERLAVDDISFSVREGELFAFLGENGAGKSTTINMLCTILEKTKGDVTICGGTLGNVLLNGVLDNIDKSIGGLDDGMFIDTMKEVFTFSPYVYTAKDGIICYSNNVGLHYHNDFCIFKNI